ncbi:MAG: glycosyltransferase family 4 protein [Chloroflexota bacterium]
MKVLMINTFNYMRGGAERCFLELINLLEENGHEVIKFCMHHEKNEPSPYEEHFLSHIDFPTEMKNGGLGGKVRVFERVLYSREAKQKIETLIQETKPDIAHLHGIAHEISPSILPAIKKYNIPIIQTLHDYKLICPNTNFVSNNKVCEQCKGHRYFNVVKNRCKRGSLPASLLSGVELYFHKMTQIYERHVDTFISPSEFLKHKVESFGIQNQIVNIPNFINIEGFTPCFEPDDYFVFFGRLVSTKGIQTLLEAMRQVKKSKLLVAGSGELEEPLKQYCQEHQITNVEFLGYLNTDKIIPLLQKARFVMMPSEWYENYSMAVLESFACGTPVLGAKMGGIPEQVIEGQTGLLFESGNADEMATKINYMLDHPQEAIQMSKNARKFVEQNNDPASHYEQTISLYHQLVDPIRM